MNNEPIFFKTLLLKGEAGGTIDRIEKTATVGTTDTYTIYLNDGSTTTFNVTNGTSIASIEYTSSSGNVDTYTVTLTDGSTTTFNVTNGEDYSVPTDGVIYYDGTDIPDGYEEAPAPSGSGSYATIDDSNVSVSTTYSSSKIEQLISGIGGGGVDYSTAEQDTGIKWVDGKPIYQKTFLNIGNGAWVYIPQDIETLIDKRGTFKKGVYRYGLDDSTKVTSISIDTSTGVMIIDANVVMENCQITLWYTKTTDTV